MLVVNDFAITHHHKHDTLHLLDVLNQKCTTTIDWKVAQHIWISLS